MAKSLRIPIIYGATASGKSSLARGLASRVGGVVINSDSMQLYRNLRLLTACPEEDNEVSHYLYGIFDAREVASVGIWLDLCLERIEFCRASGVVPIICGGNGMYIQALMSGLSRIPSIPIEVRNFHAERLRSEGLDVLYRELCEVDRASASLIEPNDGQRILRALSVYHHTGKAFSLWWESRSAPPSDYEFIPILHLAERGDLHVRVGERLRGMVARGAIEEVGGLLRANLSDELPLMRAIGVREFSGYLRGEFDFGEALEQAEVSTRQYIKRQTTWARTQYSPRLHIDRIIGCGDGVIDRGAIDKVANLLAFGG